MLGPFYIAGAPERDKVGEGYLLSGVVRSSVDCSPISGAQVELWLAGPDGEYSDDYRATLFASQDGSYAFESHFPPPYSGRPSHIHLRISAAGFETLVTQHYPVEGQVEASFDLVLTPAD
jgi:protocatechuate 3,4-dioxygenase beta subunit